ncbi:MAG TPA: 30S ribosomal protein S17 [Clostridia bacterium]|nr:30S ribosomal protein S17 [Clostridia bacterium]
MTRGRRKTRVGIVVSDKMEKTVVVDVEHYAQHSLYKKIIRHNKRIKAHDAENICKVGDKVRIMETRPISKDKKWRVVQVIEKAPLM